MTRLFINPKFKGAFAALGWNSFGQVFSHFLPDYERLSKMTVKPVTFPSPGGGFDAFFKLYHHQHSGWTFWLRSSKARCEFKNYSAFEKLGVPAAEAVACGEERNMFGILRRAFILTRTVPAAVELDKFILSAPPRALRQVVARQLAAITRRLHESGFFHSDLVWRNVLVSAVSPGSVKVFLIDCPRGFFSRIGRKRLRVRDLASLDKAAVKLISRAERMRFLLDYLGKRRPDAEARALATACLDYRRRRWPEDWRGK